MESEKNITVYCGSSDHTPQKFTDAAVALGREIAAAGAGLVYGAGRTGLMGAVADSVLAAGGRVTGIIPEFMVRRGWHHTGLTELRTVDTMHTRKAMMISMAKGIIALPGGIGTFEELTEAITWRQLGLFDGNVVIYNVDGYYDNFLAMMETAISEGFMNPDHRGLCLVATDAAAAVRMAMGTPEQNTFSPKF